METLILFYKYVDIQYPTQVLKWQTQTCTDLGLKGRVILAHEGINGILSGSQENIDSYINIMNQHELFGGIDFKKNTGLSGYHPRLRIVVKNEIVNFGVDTKKITAQMGGVHLKPEQIHQLLENKPENLIILDARNNYESRIGTFTDAIVPDITNFRDLPKYLDENLDQFKDKQVLMFCTGGVRCERATAYLKEKDVAQSVYQIEGGIERYVEKFPDGFFRGSNYVFDGRVSVKINDDVLSNCELCSVSCDEYNNCMNASCNKQFIACDPCLLSFMGTCSQNCKDLVEQKLVPLRSPFKKAAPHCPEKSDNSACPLV